MKLKGCGWGGILVSPSPPISLSSLSPVCPTILRQLYLLCIPVLQIRYTCHPWQEGEFSSIENKYFGLFSSISVTLKLIFCPCDRNVSVESWHEVSLQLFHDWYDYSFGWLTRYYFYRNCKFIFLANYLICDISLSICSGIEVDNCLLYKLSHIMSI